MNPLDASSLDSNIHPLLLHRTTLDSNIGTTSHLQHHLKLNSIFIQNCRHYSSPSNQSDPTPNSDPYNSNPEDMKHQEIEGPTVEKDLSPLAKETREVIQSLLKSMYKVSRVLAMLGLAHLGMGAYCYASAAAALKNTTLMIEIGVTSVLAFGFPFSMAFMLRQSLKSMHFFQKMEHIGRLQILTSTMQISKQIRQFFVRLAAISYLCLVEVSSFNTMALVRHLFDPKFARVARQELLSLTLNHQANIDESLPSA